MTAEALPDRGAALPEGKEARLLGLLADCAAKLLGASDPVAMIDYLFEMVRDELKLDVYFHYRLDGEQHLFLEAHGGLTPQQAEAGRRLRFGQAVCGTVARDRVPRLASNIQADKDPLTDFIRAVGLDSYACTPLIHGEVLLGTLGFGRRCPEPFTASELRFLRTVCSYVAMAKNRALVEGEMLEALRARDAVAEAQAGLMASVAQKPSGDEVALAAMLAHEMVQPLSAASNYIATVEMALNGTGGPDVLERLAQARAQISRSAQIVSRTRALVQNGEVNVERVAVRALFDEAVEIVAAASPSLVPLIAIEGLPELEAQVLADRVQIVQVLANLIRNAAQATRGSPNPRIDLSARTAGETVELCVADNGPGFPEAPASGSTTGGLGIGLLVSRRILAAHDGELIIGRSGTGGARLSFRLTRLPEPAPTDG